ncbi:MAG: nitrate ABC transporter substrate-binding protein [Deltaproteobacteria bacterium CG_4_8_14_3_um_filter_51_11]|nr:ABC transporter substrate-binding protein [bacterium]NCP07770.1 ABC transporter substrate-binding protein [bacterium]PIX18362.1 MAG: nitrate ABC transporter substrate-binding protein [Deltaproteobacteria bacterium CG_4_8_14_3_um_filter_51_11]PIY22098.1 MAG: nitrate ABC transporter substrate-binding protein [Deltaproteobacteria bacterium CG_4_10_14_3_um_filter_51_14]
MNTIDMSRREFLIKSSACAAVLLASPYMGSHSWAANREIPLRIAVEFNDHAASAYTAIDRKLYIEEGLNVAAYESYVTGAALAAALSRGAISAAYICLIPAINAFANGGVPIKVVCGTHLYGYGLAVNPDKIRSPEDLEKPGMRVGCLAEGTAIDTVMHRVMEQFHLDKQKVLAQTRRMGPPKAVMAVRAKQLDAVFLPEHWVTSVERYGFSMLLSAREVWPDMIGSVLIAREELIHNSPETVRKLVLATKKATTWMLANPEESAQITARHLSFENDKTGLKDLVEDRQELNIAPELVFRSMKHLEYETHINKKSVQDVIDNAARLGNINKAFPADDIMDLQFLQQS